MAFGFVKENKPLQQSVKKESVVVKSKEALSGVAANKSVIKAISSVKDPELDMDVWTLGLIYDIKQDNKSKVSIVMTFTSPLCPYGPQIVSEIEGNLKKIGFSSVDVEVVIEPRWEPPEEVKEMLGF